MLFSFFFFFLYCTVPARVMIFLCVLSYLLMLNKHLTASNYFLPLFVYRFCWPVGKKKKDDEGWCLMRCVMEGRKKKKKKKEETFITLVGNLFRDKWIT